VPSEIDTIDDTLANFRQTATPPNGWAYLAAEAVRWLNHATIDPGGYPYPADVYSAIGHLQTLLQRLPQALRQTAHALEVMDAAGRTVDVFRPERTAVTVLTVTESLARAASHAEAAAGELASAQVPAGRLAYRDPSSDPGTAAGER
jgi:hypothetical protein